MAAKKQKMIKVTLVKSTIGRLKNHIACVHGLGLRKTNHSATVIDTPEMFWVYIYKYKCWTPSCV